MSKKLLMNNCTENGLMPVTDGLICWLDGRDYKTGEKVWQDRSGNNSDAHVIGCEGTSFSIQLNNESDEFAVNKILISDEHKPYTLEVYFKSNRTPEMNENIIIANNRMAWHGSTSVCITPEGRLFFDMGNHTIINNYKIKNPYHIVITKSSSSIRRVFLNGTYTVASSMFTNGIHTLGGWGSPKLKGEYYSIRLYNRALTEEEIQQNYLYEQSIERGE